MIRLAEPAPFDSLAACHAQNQLAYADTSTSQTPTSRLFRRCDARGHNK